MAVRLSDIPTLLVERVEAAHPEPALSLQPRPMHGPPEFSNMCLAEVSYDKPIALGRSSVQGASGNATRPL